MTAPSKRWSYDEWVTVQRDHVLTAVKRFAMLGIFDAAVWVIPSHGGCAGVLYVSRTKPDGACDVLRFLGVGDRISAVPSESLYSRLWDACRRMPICPTQESL